MEAGRTLGVSASAAGGDKGGGEETSLVKASDFLRLWWAREALSEADGECGAAKAVLEQSAGTCEAPGSVGFLLLAMEPVREEEVEMLRACGCWERWGVRGSS